MIIKRLIFYISVNCFDMLVNSPPSEYDNKHNVVMALGNGLRPEVWKQFTERFKVENILEFYGATEGNSVLVNNANKVGAIGFLSPLLQKIIPSRIIKFDPITEAPVRDKNGFCIDADIHEAGEYISRIESNHPLRRFDGYSDPKATQKKILQNVFQMGDQYFRSGDLLKRDQDYFVYFVDRIGDTFRWKGENCSTAEVASVLSTVVSECVVYGMTIPGQDGRCGMALIQPNKDINFSKIYAHLNAELPPYAIPVFLRINTNVDTIEVTGTFKHRKVTLVTEGFDPSTLRDDIYLLNTSASTYIKLDNTLHSKVINGVYRL